MYSKVVYENEHNQQMDNKVVYKSDNKVIINRCIMK